MAYVPPLQLLELTSFGDPGPRYYEVRHGWILECWTFWHWEDEFGVWV